MDNGGQSANGLINWWAHGNTGMGLMHASWGKVTLGHWDVYYNEFERNLGLPRAQPLQYNLGLGIMSQVATTAGGGATSTTVGTGTRNAAPVSLPLTSGHTSATARAAPVPLGMMFCAAARPPFQSFLLGPSTVFCVAV